MAKTLTKTQTLEAGLIGWRERLAQKVEKPVSKRTPLNGRQIRAILGALFVINAALYLGRVFNRAVTQRR
ncbi:MAG TPA: hypothetical protein VFP24_05250 [Gaiellaceae bacterium]|jgi:hypothetical protein|nr:hypothetical protein [Gaiellaceae bacterium]